MSVGAGKARLFFTPSFVTEGYSSADTSLGEGGMAPENVAGQEAPEAQYKPVRGREAGGSSKSHWHPCDGQSLPQSRAQAAAPAPPALSPAGAF